MEKKFIPLPIDGKNILEDWEWLADDGRYLEDSHRNSVFVMFFDNHVPWTMSYMRYGNAIHLQQVCPAYSQASFLSVKKKLLSASDKEQGVTVSLSFPGDGSIIAFFWGENE